MLSLLDSATRRVAEIPRGPGGEVGLYVCGPTVYGPPHVGHGRVTLAYDVLRRYLAHAGVRVHHVSNVTDVDDKIIGRAQAEGRDPKDVAAEAEAQWWRAMDALGALRPDDVPHATGYVPEMVELIGELVSRGAAYPTPDGVYLSVAAVPDYGLLSHQSPEELRAGARVEVAGHKRAPADFALWKAAKAGEPEWASPFGPGRPGWHTECVVMSLALLGEGFSLHGGGTDLVFPHHENERAQAVALGRPFARHWVHSGMVVVAGEKMSKSLGNVLDLAALLEAVDPRAYRMLVLRSHYRSPIEVEPEILEDAARAVGRVDALARRLAPLVLGAVRVGQIRAEAAGASGGGTATGAPEAGPAAAAAALEAAFSGAMDADLDTPGALAGLFEGIRRANALDDAGDAPGALALGSRALELIAALGLQAAAPGGAPFEVEALVEQREAARASRDFAAADRLRAEVEQRGWQVEDTPAGPRLRPAG